MKRRRWIRVGLAAKVATVVALAASILSPGAAEARHHDRGAATVVDVDILGQVAIATGATADGTEIGGLSSITWDERRGVYHIISDDQGNRATGDPVRFYTVTVDLADGSLDDGDITFGDATTLLDADGSPYAPGGLDPEGLVLANPGSFYVSSEGNIIADPIIDPFIRRYNINGRVTATLPIPEHYLPNGMDRGVRFNLGFESLNLTPDGRHLVTAGEGALFQDGPPSTFDNGSLARILLYDLARRDPVAEYVYEVDPWAEPSAIFGVNGIVEVLPIDNVGTMLVMERSFSVGGVGGSGTGNVVTIHEISTAGATNVLSIDALYDDGSPIALTPVAKRLVFSFDDLGVPIDNIEGMTFGPTLPDGRRTLVIVSDNNFSAGQFTQFVVLALDLG